MTEWRAGKPGFDVFIGARGPLALGKSENVYAKFAPYFADPSDASLSAEAANPNAAKVLIDYLCSAEGQKKVADTGEFVMAPGVYPAIKDADKIMAGLFLMNEADAAQLAKLQGELRQWFTAK